MSKTLRKARIILIIILLAGWGLLWASSGLLTESIWFRHLGYGDVFIRTLFAKVAVQLVVFLFAFAIYYGNLRMALRRAGDSHPEDAFLPPMLQLYRELIVNRLPVKAINWLLLILGLAMAASVSYQLGSGWAVWLQFMYRTPFGIADPVLGLDVGFFVFTLPVLELLHSLLLSLLIWLLPVTATIYVVFNPSQLLGWQSSPLKFSQKHLLVQFGLLLLLIAWEFVLRALRLTLTPNSLFLGAGFTDVYVRLPGYLLSGLVVALLALSCLRGVQKWHLRGFARKAVLALLVIGVVTVALPALVQRLVVEPNQFAKEKGFLEHHIRMTQQAYGLTQVEERQFPSEPGIPDLTAYRPTIDNIRLWDWRPIQQCYNQLQALSYYYHFTDIDVDRYRLDGQLRQVMLGAREIDVNRFEPHVQTWTNTRLRYTHGYGLVMSPVDEATVNGLPQFLIKDIPPVGNPGLPVERPEIYFGELTKGYVITNTKIKEFDYPRGEDNAETVYRGTGGIKLDTYLKRLLFAARFADYRLLVSGEIDANSEIIIHRQILDRVQRIAPFLRLDDDPYLVLDQGRLFWLLDAYTLNSNYPYAARTRGWGNYIRNSVKVVVDAYNGDVSFYLTDPTDPLALTWQKAFPGLFRDLKTMPPGLQAHLRYPVSLFRIQAQVYAKYHMNNPLVFYNDEDAWKIPEEKYLAETVSMDPYYAILQLDQASEPEFILMLPFIPAKQIANMVGWMAALNDPPNYGKLIVYKFFKDRHVYGPMQIESRIDQDSEISQQLTLWDQRGSNVIRGNLLVIPLDGAILYVEPIFLQSEQSSIPELSRVILVFEDQVIMARTLDEALAQAFGQLPDREVPAEPAPGANPASDHNLGELARQAKAVFEQAITAQREGNWAAYGDYLKHLETILNELSQLSSGASPVEAEREGSSHSEPQS